MPNLVFTLFTSEEPTVLTGQAALDWHAANRDPKMKVTSGKGKAPMTAETRSSQIERKPRSGTRDGRKYDERRAFEYIRQLTGVDCYKAIWEGDLIRYVVGDDGERRQIPHWDWTGHLDTIEDCELRFEFAA